MKSLENKDHIVKFDLKLNSHLSFLKHIGACIPTGSGWMQLISGTDNNWHLLFLNVEFFYREGCIICLVISSFLAIP